MWRDRPVIGISVCCKGRPVFFCVRRRIVKDRRSRDKSVHETAEAWCASCLPSDIRGHSNVTEISEERFHEIAREMRSDGD